MAYSSSEASCSKFFMYFVNTIFFLIGASLLAFCLYDWFTAQTAAWYNLPHQILTAGIVLGAFLLVVSIVGFSGVNYKSCILIYTFLVLILLIGQVVIGIILYRGTLTSESSLSKMWDGMNNNQRLLVQQRGNCCGFSGASDRYASSDTCPNYNQPGCFTSMQQFYTSSSYFVYISLFSLAGLELVTFLWSMLMLCGCCGVYKPDEYSPTSPYYM